MRPETPQNRPQYHRLRRIIAMVRDGMAGGRLPNRSDFRRELEVSPRTLARDLDFLRDEERAPIAYEPARHGYRLTDATYDLPPVNLSRREVFSFSLARKNNPVVYRVIAVEPASGPGDLHYGLGILYAGKVGNEYFLTKGHLHQTREAAEVYIGQSGEGLMLLEDEHTGESRTAPLGAGQIVYVPGHTAHRTVNTGSEPLTYFGIYPANAGHDYGAIAKRNFLKVVVEENGHPVMKDRTTS